VVLNIVVEVIVIQVLRNDVEGFADLDDIHLADQVLHGLKPVLVNQVSPIDALEFLLSEDGIVVEEVVKVSFELVLSEVLDVESQVVKELNSGCGVVFVDLFEKSDQGFGDIICLAHDCLGLLVEVLSDLLVGDLLSDDQSDEVEEFGLEND
jgi:hypothetical protein